MSVLCQTLCHKQILGFFFMKTAATKLRRLRRPACRLANEMIDDVLQRRSSPVSWDGEVLASQQQPHSPSVAWSGHRCVLMQRGSRYLL